MDKKPELNFSEFVKEELFNDRDRIGIENALKLQGLNFTSFDYNATNAEEDFADAKRNLLDAFIASYDRAIEKVKQNTQNLIDTESIGESYKIYLEASKDSKKQSIIFICRLREGIGDFFSMQLPSVVNYNKAQAHERLTDSYKGQITKTEEFAKAIEYFKKSPNGNPVDIYLGVVKQTNDKDYNPEEKIKNSVLYELTYNFFSKFITDSNKDEITLITKISTYIALAAQLLVNEQLKILVEEQVGLRPDMLFNCFFTENNKTQVLLALGSNKEEGKSPLLYNSI